MSESEKEYYWSLIIEPGWVQAGVWSLEDEVVRVMSTSNALAWETEENLVEAVDAALSSAITDFPVDAKEPQKTVFGVPPSWVSEGQIEKKYLGYLKEICSRLSLSPGGFVVLPEAIAHSIKINEGSPLTGVVIGLGESVIDVTLFRLGNLVGTVNVGRSVSVVDDVVEGLTRFNTGEHIPSRFLLYDGKEGELEEIGQQLLLADWQSGLGQNLKFLHEPKMEIIKVQEKVVAVCAAGASEMGEVKGVSMTNEKNSSVLTASEDEAEEPNVVSDDEGLSAEEVGFVVGGDVEQIEKGDQNNEMEMPEGEAKKSRINLRFAKSIGFWKKLIPGRASRGLPKMRLPGMARGKVPMLIAGGAILLVVMLVGAWWYLPRATVTIFVSPKQLTESVFVSFDEGVGSPDFESFVLPAETISVSVSGSGSRSATGSRLVGEKAKGEVTIRNGTSSEIKLSSDVVMVGPNDLEFVALEEATVGAAVSPSSPGTLTVAATARDIGDEYNLAKGEAMEVGNYPKSEVDAVVETDFTGGDSRETVAISESDLTKLEDEVTEKLSSEGEAELTAKAGSGVEMVQEAIRKEVTKRDFSGEAGDEANSVSLELTMDVVGLVVSRDLLVSLAKNMFGDQVPEGFTLLDGQINTDFVFEGEGDGIWDFDVTFEANLLPEVNPDEVISKVAGKYPPRAQEYLMTIPGFSRAEIKVKPQLPGKLGIIPWLTKHIEIEVVADK